MGSPPRGGESGSGKDDAGASLSKGCKPRSGSGGFSGLSSKRLIVFQRGVSWASRRPARRRPAARAAVVAGDGVTVRFRTALVAARSGRALHYILQRTIMLDKVEVRSGNGPERDAEIADDGNGFEKNFG